VRNISQLSIYIKKISSVLDEDKCTPQKMAEAGFYACGDAREPDLVRCLHFILFLRKISKSEDDIRNILWSCTKAYWLNMHNI
jgi:hypothetical protein